MGLCNRKITYRLYPTAQHVGGLESHFGLHQRLYNAGLEQRIDAYRKQKKSLSFADQCRELTQLRKECPEYAELNAQSCQVTLKRLDLAFQAFFRRVKQGEKRLGFPRFKSRDRFSGFGFKSHGDGFKLETSGSHGYLKLSGIGKIKIRGKARTFGEVKTAEITRKNDKWYVSVTVKCEPKRKSGDLACAIDWGVETFATIADSKGEYQEIENPRYLKKALGELKTAQQDLSRKKPGSEKRKKAIGEVRKISRDVAEQRKNHLHQTSAQIVKQSALLASEKLNVKNMTANGGAYKKGLNREILNTAPATFISFLKYKAEEAGIMWKEIPTRQVKPSQTCSNCGIQEKKPLFQRSHQCKCGLNLTRDQNAARVILNWALTGNATGWEPPGCGEVTVASMKQETHAIFA